MKYLAMMLIAIVGVSRGTWAQPVARETSDGGGSNPVRAAGMPLRDGALPPGMMTVRVVQGGFSNNLASQAVTVDVIGGKSETLSTGTDGRASFAHLPIGSSVRASVVVAGQRLESEVFPMPAESGVRILLIAGDADGSAASMPPATGTPPADAWHAAVAPPPAADSAGTAAQASSSARSIAAIRLTWIAATVIAGLFGTRLWWTNRG
jgi:hypothetical protein